MGGGDVRPRRRSRGAFKRRRAAAAHSDLPAAVLLLDADAREAGAAVALGAARADR